MSKDATADSAAAATLAVIARFNAAFNAHDVDAIMALMTDDCVFENTSPAPDGTRVTGQADVRDAWLALFRDSPHAHFTSEDEFAAGDRATVRWTYTWGSPVAGHVRGVDVFRVRNNKVAEKFAYVKG